MALLLGCAGAPQTMPTELVRRIAAQHVSLYRCQEAGIPVAPYSWGEPQFIGGWRGTVDGYAQRIPPTAEDLAAANAWAQSTAAKIPADALPAWCKTTGEDMWALQKQIAPVTANPRPDTSPAPAGPAPAAWPDAVILIPW